MGEVVDPAFIQDTEHRPKLSIITEAEEIPLIDLSAVLESSDRKGIEKLVKEIGNACKEWGFFQVINHGVPLEKRLRIETVAKKFFALPLEEKRKVSRDEERVTGYYDAENTKNIKDWKEVFDFTVEDPTVIPVSPDPHDNRLTYWTNKWPEYPPQLREACEEYVREVGKLALKLMELIALSLGLEANRFNSHFKDHTSFVRLNHYPPCSSPDLVLGVGRHKDGGALTVLSQDNVGGLQVKRKLGDWIRVKPTPDAYIINVGDILQVWSNDRYESVEHRVMVNSEKDRFSIPYFFNPAYYTLVKPLEELIDEQNPPKYKAYSWGKFLITHRKLTKAQL